MNEANGLNEVMFTSASVLDLLLQIDELRDYTISLTETLDGNIQLQVGDSTYLIENQDAKTIEVDDEVVGEIEVTNEDAYQDILNDSSGDIEQEFNEEPIEGSIIKEFAKSLALGGMIRFAQKHLLK